ncbi:hypothetical protein LEN26_004610 [Aphanomyces euteiches]|nr:hypothetical protein LEN26_004610 [Aphanomyces euteiches]KAH9194045.1 hypothetical protein AeNC1_003989 [Aphanomyces euteiches]
MRRRRSFFKLLLSLLSASVSFSQTLEDIPFRTVEALWTFDKGLESWARSSSDLMHAEINPQDGNAHGSVLDSPPFIDSPLLELNVVDRHYFVVRFAYDGSCTQAGLHLERSGKTITSSTNPKAPFVNSIVVRFSIVPDGIPHVYYAPIYEFYQGEVSRIRFFPCMSNAQWGHTFNIDWIALIKAPTITKVRGCIDQYFISQDRSDPIADIALVMNLTNDVLPVFSTNFESMDLPFASTYNCMAGDTVRIQGRNFGDTSLVRINGQPCEGQPLISQAILADDTDVEEVISCVLPPGPPGLVTVTVQNERYRGLQFDGAFLSYAVPADLSTSSTVSNVMAYAVDITWAPPPSLWTSLTVTGYEITWFVSSDLSSSKSKMVGNVTTTTLLPLLPSTVYSVTVAAVVESQNTPAWQQVDMYGQRSPLPSAIVGQPSPPLVFQTLPIDVLFSSFLAGSTLNHSATNPLTTLGPTGDVGGQGAFGLTLLGHAHIENCNATSSCCDFDATGTSCLLVCKSTTIRSPSSKAIRTAVSSASASNPLPAKACGPSLRLTGSAPFLTGAAWYPRPLNVREGFDTTFKYRISNPSFHCKNMDDVATHCRARGGDGFAFVVQNVGQEAIGEGGFHLGYGGIPNSLSVEFDTTYNPEMLDLYENHISVHTRGYDVANSGDHSYSLGATSQIPDLTDGIHSVRIRYVPYLDDDQPFHPYFQATAYVSQFLAASEEDSATHIRWYTAGLGCLTIDFDDRPVLSVPIHLDATLRLTGGRAFVGFTAATGEKAWQVHDIVSWQIDSLRNLPPNQADFIHA